MSKVSALTLLDLSAAFDTICHSFFYNASVDILAFLVQLFGDSNHIFSESRKDPSLALFCLAYALHKPLLIKISVIICMPMIQVYISLSQSNAQESLSTLSSCLTDI